MAPLPEARADVKAFIAEYAKAVPLTVPFFDFLFLYEEEAPWYAHLVDDYVHFEMLDRFLEDVERRLEADEGLGVLSQQIYDQQVAEWAWDDRAHSDNRDIQQFLDGRRGYTETCVMGVDEVNYYLTLQPVVQPSEPVQQPWYLHIVDDHVQLDIVEHFCNEVERRLQDDGGLGTLDQTNYQRDMLEEGWTDRIVGDGLDIQNVLDEYTVFQNYSKTCWYELEDVIAILRMQTQNRLKLNMCLH
jgi:hypothetical protein